ncbi:hypothetical protein F7725_026982, partial [Dissostichus mawsoni]
RIKNVYTTTKRRATVLQEDGDILKKEITAVKEELHLKHQTILGLKEQLQNLTATALQRPQPATSNTQLTEPRPSTSSLLLQPSPQPSSTPQHEPQPSTSYQLDNIPPSTIKITTDTEATDAENQRHTSKTGQHHSNKLKAHTRISALPPVSATSSEKLRHCTEDPTNIGRNGANLGEITTSLALYAPN